MVSRKLKEVHTRQMDMTRGGGVNWVIRSIDWIIRNIVDAIPPYRIAEGPLENKETDPGGKFIVTVNAVMVEVDKGTFDALVIGETLRVRYTRARRAINIDRVLPGRGPG
jgi:hypothetical protein